MSSNPQENPNRVKDCIRTRDGRVSVEKLTGIGSLIMFTAVAILIGADILSKDITNIVATGIAGSFGLLGANGFSKNH